MSVRYYPALVIQDPGDGPDDGYGVVFPDFPGCVSCGETLETAASAGAEALSLHVAAMLQAGEAIPMPSPRDALPDWLIGEPAEVVDTLMLPVELPQLAQRA